MPRTILLSQAELSQEAARIVLGTLRAGGEATGFYYDKLYHATLKQPGLEQLGHSPQSYSDAVKQAVSVRGFQKRVRSG